ncbi:MAG: potassium channel protein [Lewinellaceae bacterium]|nr:potassium channel protein [Lewinellaceae bacterium]
MFPANAFHYLLVFFRVSRRLKSRQSRFRRVYKIVQRIRIAFILAITAVTVGMLGYVLIEGYSWFDAYYMAIITLASVGYGEVHPLSDAGRLFTSIYILFNVGIFAYAISTITGIFAEGGFSKLLHDFRMNQRIEDLTAHVIVCGFGKHATEVAQELSKQGIPFVIIEKKSEKIDQLQYSGHLYIEGDATDDEVLIEAGIDRAKALVLTLPDDADNLFVTLSARQINHKLRIISRAGNLADEVKIRRAGADHTVVPEQIGGFYMATLVNKPDLVEFFNLLSNMGPSNVVFEEIEVNRLLPEMQGKAISESGLYQVGRISVVGIRYPNGQYQLNPPSSPVLHPDWHLVVLGNAEQMQHFKQNALSQQG